MARVQACLYPQELLRGYYLRKQIRTPIGRIEVAMVNINGFVCLWQVLPRGVGLSWHFASPKTRVGLPKPSTITIQLGVEWQHVLPATTALNVKVLSYVYLQWNSSGEETLFQNLPCSACKVIDAMARVHEDLWETTLRVITCGQFYPDSLTYQLSTYYLSNAIIDPVHVRLVDAREALHINSYNIWVGR